MNFRFAFEATIGAICFTAILIFGSQGNAALALFALLPVIMRLKKVSPDEREKQLFYKIGNLTFGLSIIALLIVYYLSDTMINGHSPGNNWLTLSVAGIILMHGISGLIIFKIQ